ncbi:MAG: arylamine N-acetyltransferase [bacterium]
MFDLDQYLSRIGLQAKVGQDVETLYAIQMAHSTSIPFEHISVLQRLGVSVEPDDIFEKLVVKKRGGYCFEQNGLLLQALQAIGFDARPLGARVRLEMPRSAQPPRTHVFVVVEMQGIKWILDAGFGGFSLTAPLKWELDLVQPTPHETRRIVFEEGRYFHQSLLGDEWADMCEFTGEEMPMVDRKLANWYTSTYPESRFNTRLAVGLARPDGTRYGLMNDRFIHRRGGEVLEQTEVADKSSLLALLKEKFNLDMPADTSFGAWPFKG